MNRTNKILLIIVSVIFLYLCTESGIHIDCIIRKMTGIKCPGCGLTRAFRNLLKLHIITAIKYNILVIPIVLFYIVVFIDVLKNTTYTDKIFRYISSHVVFTLCILLIITIINNINCLV